MMATFKALNGGSPGTAEPPSIKVDSSAAEEQRKGSVSSARAPDEAQNSGEEKGKLERPTVQTANQGDSSLKRKRSISTDVRRDQNVQERTPDTATAPSHGESRDPFGTPRRDRPSFSAETREKESWYSAQSREDGSSYASRQGSAASPPAQTDEQIGEALRRATTQDDSHDYPNTSPEADDRSVSYYASHRGPDPSTDPVQRDGKKRKRNFSNRTKTGCLTCRQRKKKCDEAKPECQNCVNGNWVCAGYPTQQRGSSWQKQDNKSPTVPLESKDPSYVPPGAYGMPQQGPAGGQPSVKREQLPGYRGHTLRIDPPQGRPLVTTEDDRPTASTLASASAMSPENKLSALPYTPANAFPTPISANTQPPSFSERMPKDYQRVPPLHDLSRTEPETPHPGGHLPQINILHAARPQTSSPAPTGPHQQSNPQVAAQLALGHTSFSHKRTQKEEMLSGRYFYPFDKELCLERERCAAACWRFNNLSSPPYGVSTEERSRLFLEILQPRDPVRLAGTETSTVTPVGRVGRSVTVETPFVCDYGYNIRIGNNVSVGRNCTFNDVSEVSIGDNTIVGPNVSIYTTDLPDDPKKRQGGQGPQYGKRVSIAEDCFIGGGAILLPNIKIGKGSTVGAGSVVTKDVPPFTVVAGNPARVLRGIAG